MFNRSLNVVVLIIYLGLTLGGCPQTTVRTKEPLSKKAEEMAKAERERTARLEAERKEKEAKELVRMKEEKAKKAQAEKELEAEKERAARREAERAIREKELKAIEVEVKRVQAEKELEAERERAARHEAERAMREKALKAIEMEVKRALAEKEKEFEKTLVAKKYPGIEGEVFESTLLKDIRFDYDRYDIGPVDAEILKENAALLLEYPNVKIQVEGHCDERGTQEYNLALGERRANSVKEYLISLGIAGDRISTISYGEENPIDPGHNEEAWSRNRRAHFIILSR